MRIDEFLLARIAEDEAAVHAETVRGLHVGNFPPGSHSTHGSDQVGTVDLGCRTCRAFVVSFYAGPRVLAECEAKRAVVAGYRNWRDLASSYPGDRFPEYRRAAYEAVLIALAAVYAGHPDYDPAWRL